MPYEVSMSGGQPWGFRLSNGSCAGTACVISRITPGGKAAQANVMQGDVLVAVNGDAISDLPLNEVMRRIKSSGDEVHLTLLSQEEIEASLKNKRQSEVNFTTATEIERPASNLPPHSPRFIIKITSVEEQKQSLINGLTNGHHVTPSDGTSSSQNSRNSSKITIATKNAGHPTTYSKGSEFVGCLTPVQGYAAVPRDIPDGFLQPQTQGLSAPSSPRSASPSVQVTPQVEERADQPTPKPRNIPKQVEHTIEEQPTSTELQEQEKPNYPDYVKRHLKPQKPLPEFKPQVNWLHGKLKINLKSNPNALSDPGNKLKTAAQAHPNQPIEIEGPLSATVVHAQYNTPVGLYSGSQIVNTLIGTATAKGAKVSESGVFGSDDMEVNKDTPVYKLVHNRERATHAPAQSRSIQILDALLAQPDAKLPSAF